MIAAIACVDSRLGIGRNDETGQHLLINIPDDMKHFKLVTSGHVVIMGRKTFESLVNKPLKNRINIVVSTQLIEYDFDNTRQADMTRLYLVGTIYDAIDTAISMNAVFKNDTFIIGGQSIYEQTLCYCDKLFLTAVYQDLSGANRFFPKHDSQFILSKSSAELKHDNVTYKFVEYVRK